MSSQEGGRGPGGRERDVTAEAEARAMRAKGHGQPLEAGRSKERWFPRASRRPALPAF